MVQKRKGREHRPNRRPWARYVKKFTHRKDRQAPREALSQERYDDIPRDRPVKEEDPWCWD